MSPRAVRRVFTALGAETLHEKELLTVGADLGHVIKAGLPPNIGFALLIFDVGPDGFMTYTSSGSRETMIRALRELLTNLTTQAEYERRRR